MFNSPLYSFVGSFSPLELFLMLLWSHRWCCSPFINSFTVICFMFWNASYWRLNGCCRENWLEFDWRFQDFVKFMTSSQHHTLIVYFTITDITIGQRKYVRLVDLIQRNFNIGNVWSSWKLSSKRNGLTVWTAKVWKHFLDHKILWKKYNAPYIGVV